ncbi:hypothetical protein MSG28_008414 [Choristoneura fumiferana]|uniref:Uncharacterized protein n=1 Tax=Choristoneura fumiferana TaxID=7141 RepID=A0ACC0J6P0_CHOFU|nr:hypothetical protein MSG28_008414 [Choristoneura fumiferana]
MLPPTAGIAQEQRDRPEMAYQQRRDVRELTREIIRDAARAANRQQSISPGGLSDSIELEFTIDWWSLEELEMVREAITKKRRASQDMLHALARMHFAFDPPTHCPFPVPMTLVALPLWTATAIRWDKYAPDLWSPEASTNRDDRAFIKDFMSADQSDQYP